MVDFESAAKKLSTVNETGLSQVSKLAQMQLQVEQRVADLEAELKTAKSDLKAIAEDQLPAARLSTTSQNSNWMMVQVLV